MTPFRSLKELPNPSLTAFVTLQVLDILTTLIGLRMGARETSVFIGRLIQIGPVAGLLLSKIQDCAASVALAFRPAVNGASFAPSLRRGSWR